MAKRGKKTEAVEQPEEAPKVEQAEETLQEESYGWEYHKVALLIAVSLTAIFYVLIWLFID